MNHEFLSLLDYIEKEKGIRKEILLEAISSALLSASKKAVGPARELRIDIDEKTGHIRAMASLVVVEKVENPHDEISITQARRTNPKAQLADSIDVEVTPKDFGRIAAQTAKQAIMQRLRQAEKELIYDEFKDRAGDIVTGTVRRFERSDVIVDLGRFEAIMPAKERVATEDYNVGDRIRAYVVAVQSGARGPEIILSRSHPNFVRRLFEVEVSEIADRTVELRAIAREAGYRTKIAVWSSDEKVDPVGACVGMRGSRVKNIVRELNNEKVDIIRWSDDPKELVLEALKPAKIRKIVVDQPNRTMRIQADEDQLSLAIGKRGQNARLTSRLTGWEVSIEKVETPEERQEAAAEAFENQVAAAAAQLAAALAIDPDLSRRFVDSGFSNIEGIANENPEDIAGALEIPEEQAREIQANAKKALENRATAD